MKPAQLYAALDARRRSGDLKWWQVCVELDCTYNQLSRMRWGRATPELCERGEAWLRRPVPPPPQKE